MWDGKITRLCSRKPELCHLMCLDVILWESEKEGREEEEEEEAISSTLFIREGCMCTVLQPLHL